MSNKVIQVLKFTAEWCQTCRLLDPIIKQLQQEYKQSNKPIEFITYDADNEDTKSLYDDYRIATMPTIVIVVKDKDNNDDKTNTKEVARVNGLKPKNALKILLDWQIDALNNGKI